MHAHLWFLGPPKSEGKAVSWAGSERGTCVCFISPPKTSPPGPSGLTTMRPLYPAETARCLGSCTIRKEAWLPFPSLPFPSLPFPSLPFPSHSFPPFLSRLADALLQSLCSVALVLRVQPPDSALTFPQSLSRLVCFGQSSLQKAEQRAEHQVHGFLCKSGRKQVPSGQY